MANVFQTTQLMDSHANASQAISENAVEIVSFTAWKVSKYGVFSGLYFPVFGPEKTPYLDTVRAVFDL